MMLYDISLSLYILSFLHAVLYFFLGYKNLTKITNTFATLGLCVNIGSFILIWQQVGQFPSNTLSELLKILSMSMVAVYLLLYLKFKRPLLAMFILPVVIIIGISTFGLQNIQLSQSASHSFWLYLHLPFTIIGSALFMVSAIAGLMYVMQERQLKKKHFGKIFHRFPPLNVMNQLNLVTLIIGFAFFTVGLITGVIWGLIEWNGALVLTPKLIFAFITWCIFGAIISIKHTKGFSPTGTAVWSIIGFLSIIVTYFGVALFLLR